LPEPILQFICPYHGRLARAETLKMMKIAVFEFAEISTGWVHTRYDAPMSRSKERSKLVEELSLDELRLELIRCKTMIPLLKHSKNLRQRLRQVKSRISKREETV
jgi:hypothetical protein